ncbi:MAG: hypothetical protein ACOYK6_04475 [Chthoniobacterales bacterium]
MIRQHILDILLSRLQEQRRFIQVLSGPRQVGKTTIARSAMDQLDIPCHYPSADAPTLERFKRRRVATPAVGVRFS